MNRLLKLALGMAVLQALLFMAVGNAAAQCTWKGPYSVQMLSMTSDGTLRGQFKLNNTTSSFMYTSANGQSNTSLPYRKEALAMLLTAKTAGNSVSLCVINNTTDKFSAILVRDN